MKKNGNGKKDKNGKEGKYSGVSGIFAAIVTQGTVLGRVEGHFDNLVDEMRKLVEAIENKAVCPFRVSQDKLSEVGRAVEKLDLRGQSVQPEKGGEDGSESIPHIRALREEANSDL